MKKITIIAEIGENYLGELALAKKMVNKAKIAGADYVKFQSYNQHCLKKEDPEYDWFLKVALTDQNHKILKKFSKNKNIKFLSAPFSIERAKYLCEKLKMKEIKIASAKMTEKNILKYLNLRCKKIYLSTGMSTLDEIKKSLKYLTNPEVVIMHCVSEYPLPYQNANLLAIKELKKKFPSHEIGYSDHTIGILACILAVSHGATTIEKHFTMDKNLEGTDHIISADPSDLKLLISEIQKIKILLGNEKKKPTTKEYKIRKFVRNRFKI